MPAPSASPDQIELHQSTSIWRVIPLILLALRRILSDKEYGVREEGSPLI